MKLVVCFERMIRKLIVDSVKFCGFVVSVYYKGVKCMYKVVEF